MFFRNGSFKAFHIYSVAKKRVVIKNMKNIFIDTNIYLRFYDSNNKKLKRLANSLKDIKDSIFITQQICNEIERNKLDVFKQSFAKYNEYSSKAISKISLPEHLDNGESSLIKDWNKNWDEVIKKAEYSVKNLNDITVKKLTEISDSTDEISNIFNEIFSNQEIPTGDDVSKARLRKEVGNPPGKVKDSLGDQLNWEQFLSYLNKNKDQCEGKNIEIYIISNDQDYFINYKGYNFLNPLLAREIKSVTNQSIIIHCYNEISYFFKDYRKCNASKLSYLPSDKELDEIAEKEEKTILPDPYYYIYNPTPPTECPRCGAKNSFKDGAYLTSQFGGLTWQFICNKCNFRFDTGDQFE